jgi:uncharacterized membrane protein YdjX (TVP38/TMEM64 family)
MSTRNLILAVIAIAAAVLLGRQGAAALPGFIEWVRGLGAWGPVAFVVGYIVATVAFIPGSLLTLAAGAIFGIALGTVTVFAGAVLGSAAAFLLARTVARAAIERRIAGDARFAAIDEAVARDGRKIVFLLRLSPAFPFNLMNYALGLTRVRFVDYLVASVGMLPGTLLYVYTGKIAGEVAVAAGGAAPPKGVGYYAVLGLGLLATLAVTVLVTRTARRALAEATA